MNFADKIVDTANNKLYILGLVTVAVIIFAISVIIDQTFLSKVSAVILMICLSFIFIADTGIIFKRTSYAKWGREDYHKNIGEDFVNYNLLHNPHDTEHHHRIYTIAWLDEERKNSTENKNIKNLLTTVNSNLFEQLYILTQHPIMIVAGLVSFFMSFSFFEESYGISYNARLAITSLMLGFFITYFAFLLYTAGRAEKTSSYKYAKWAKNISDIDIREYCVTEYKTKGRLFLKGIANTRTKPSFDDVIVERFI